jgi:hypothetical protein
MVNLDEMGTFCTFWIVCFPSSRAHHGLPNQVALPFDEDAMDVLDWLEGREFQ